ISPPAEVHEATSIVGAGSGPHSRSIEDSKPKATHDPDGSPNNADDETRRAEKDRNDESIALGKACIRKGHDRTTFTNPPAGYRYRHAGDQNHRRDKKQDLRETNRCSDRFDATPCCGDSKEMNGD